MFGNHYHTSDSGSTNSSNGISLAKCKNKIGRKFIRTAIGCFCLVTSAAVFY